MTDAIVASVYGNGVVAVVQGTLAGVAYAVVGLPAPLLWTAVTIVLCLIPVLGAPIVWAPAALFLALQGEAGRAIGLVLWGLLVVGTIDNILRPILIGNRTQMHPLPVLLAVVGGSILMGPLGLFMGPVVLTGTMELVDIFRRHILDRTGSPGESESSIETKSRPKLRAVT
jgi:predicted PurR-regulated permease PerM